MQESGVREVAIRKMRMRRLEETGISIILYGRSDAGKTHLIGTAADSVEGASRPLVIDFDAGTQTLRGKDVDVIYPRSWKDIQEVYQFLLHENTTYRLVALDSLTECLKKFSKAHITGELTADNVDSWVDLSRAVTPSQNEWGRVGEQMTKLIRAFRGLADHADEKRRVHVVMTALERYDESTDSVTPNLMRSLNTECAALVDCVLRLSKQRRATERKDGTVTETVHRHLLTSEYVDETGRVYSAKNRGGRLPQTMWNPTMDDILKAWKKGVENA